MTRLVLAVAIHSASVHAEPPIAVRAPERDAIMSSVSAPALDPAEGEIIYDSLCIMDNPWDAGNGDACGGHDIFGGDYDLQTADDFTLDRSAMLTGVAMDYLTFLGECPETLCISVFAGECSDADEIPYAYVERHPDACIDLVDPYGDYAAKRYVVIGDICELPAGHWYITMNPRFGDWGYVVIDLDPLVRCGDDRCDVLLRDGGNYNPCCVGNSGYSLPNWTPSAIYWGVPSAMSMQIEVRYGPEQPRCVYQVKAVRPVADICGQPCDECRYVKGDMICTLDCPGDDSKCALRLSGYVACANGAGCLVRANLTGCLMKPPECDQCDSLIYGACCFPDNPWKCETMSEATCLGRHGTFYPHEECRQIHCP